jgi:hypothetical protein
VIEFIARLVADVVAGVIGELLVAPLIRLNGRRLAKASTMRCGIRVVSGRQPGFANTWRHGMASFRPGVIEFTGEVVPITGMDSGFRQPTADELWWTSFDHRVTRVTTHTSSSNWPCALQSS